MSSYIRKLVDHMKWADAAALDALRTSPGTETRALTLYAHILGAESVWLARIDGRPSDVAVWPSLSVDECATLSARNAEAYDALLASLAPADFSREIDYRNSAGTPFRSTLEDILLHVALHGAYHRGQVALAIRDGGGEPTATDYIAFIRGAPTARTAPPSPVTRGR
jgi:uncharacterized damage-inducible protein DinB